MTPSQEREDVLMAAISSISYMDEWRYESAYNRDIIEDLTLRAKVGESKYGTPLQTDNGRDALIDLYEEMLDAFMYAIQYDLEKNRDIAETIFTALQEVASEIANNQTNRGFLDGSRQPDPIVVDNRQQLIDYIWSTTEEE